MQCSRLQPALDVLHRVSLRRARTLRPPGPMATHYDYLLRASRCSGAGPAPSARENQTTRAVFNDLFKRMIISNQGRSRDAGARTTALGHARRRCDTNALRSVARLLAETPRRRPRLSRGRHRKRSAACEASPLELLEECQPARTILLAALADAENLAIALAVDRRRHPQRYVSSLRLQPALHRRSASASSIAFSASTLPRTALRK
jgi:hypothetical protein